MCVCVGGGEATELVHSNIIFPNGWLPCARFWYLSCNVGQRHTSALFPSHVNHAIVQEEWGSNGSEGNGGVLCEELQGSLSCWWGAAGTPRALESPKTPETSCLWGAVWSLQAPSLLKSTSSAVDGIQASQGPQLYGLLCLAKSISS